MAVGRGTNLRGYLFVAFTALLAVPPAAHAADEAEPPIGYHEYRSSCAVCHGVDGRGDGALADYLTVRPPDLTVLARDNGGAFPNTRVFETIDGRRVLRAHGNSEMPVWGARYKADAFGEAGGEFEVTARILMLVFYLQGIQRD